MRIPIETEHTKGSWIEVPGGMSRKQLRELNQRILECNETELFDNMFAEAVTACHIVVADGDDIDDPSTMNTDALDNIEEALIGALSMALYELKSRVFLLGMTQSGLSLGGTETNDQAAQNGNEKQPS